MILAKNKLLLLLPLKQNSIFSRECCFCGAFFLCSLCAVLTQINLKVVVQYLSVDIAENIHFCNLKVRTKVLWFLITMIL